MIFDFTKIYNLIMGEEKKINYGLIVSLGLSILSCGITFGVCQNKIENNSREIQEIRARQIVNDRDTREINKNLAELNAKMDLLLQGKIKFVAEK